MTNAPRTLGRYALIGPLGPSRRSTLAWDPDARCMVVITTPGPGVDPARFEAAAHAAARFPHPHIAAIRSVEEYNGTPIVVSTFVRGHSLAVRPGTPTRPALVPALHQVAHLCDTLAFAHDRAMLHRPFSPDDVIVDREEEVMLVGAGIVTDVESGPDGLALVADVGAMLYAVLTASGLRRPNPRGTAPAPLATLRPDLTREATAFVDAWVTGRYAVPLATAAADLRALAACTALPSPAGPVTFSPGGGGHAASAPPPVPRAAQASPYVAEASPFDADASAALDVFMSEHPEVASVTQMPGSSPALPAVLPRTRRRRWRSGRLFALAAIAVLVLFALWRLRAPHADGDAAPATDTTPAAAQESPRRAASDGPAVSIVDEGERSSDAVRGASPGQTRRDVRPPVIVSMVQPQYPVVARQSGVVGDVLVDVAIASDGRVSAATVVGGPAILRGPAQAALRQWRFRPATLYETPIATVRRFRVSFAAEPVTARSTSPDGGAATPPVNPR